MAKLCPRKRVIYLLNNNVRQEQFADCEGAACEWWINEDYGDKGNCAEVVKAIALDKIWREMPEAVVVSIADR